MAKSEFTYYRADGSQKPVKKTIISQPVPDEQPTNITIGKIEGNLPSEALTDFILSTPEGRRPIYYYIGTI